MYQVSAEKDINWGHSDNVSWRKRSQSTLDVFRQCNLIQWSWMKLYRPRHYFVICGKVAREYKAYTLLCTRTHSPREGKSTYCHCRNNDHSVNGVTYFLRTVRSFEGKLYGYQSNATPGRVVFDRSLVLLLSFLEVFNNESLSDYLQRAFRIVTGEGTSTDFMQESCYEVRQRQYQ